MILFGIPGSKGRARKLGFDPNGIVQRAIRALKEQVPELVVITDVCIDEYTSHGHCGIVRNGKIVNDETLDCLRAMAKTHAEAGADMVAPSDMMDGRWPPFVMSWIGPDSLTAFRLWLARNSPPCFMRRFAMPPTPARSSVTGSLIKWIPPTSEALREIDLDVEEGADIIMVKARHAVSGCHQRRA